MSQILFDTNVLLDIATADATWLGWSEGQFRVAAAQGPILINPIIYAELAPAFASQADLDRWLDPAIFQRLPLPYAARLARRPGVREIPARRRQEKFPVARFLYRCARRNRGADAGDARCAALSHVLSQPRTHHTLTNISIEGPTIHLEAGLRKEMPSLTGTLATYGHEITLETLGLEIQTFVFFSEQRKLPRNLLRRTGWLQLVRLASIDSDQVLYLSPYPVCPFGMT
jgi:hypothetical protein